MRCAWAMTWPWKVCALALAAAAFIGCGSDDAPQNWSNSGGFTATGATTGAGGTTTIGAGGSSAGVGGTAAGVGGSTGTVSCPAGMALCGTSCVDVTANPTNCGACGVTCNYPIEQCTNGACVCATGYSDCGSGCVDVRSDAANCGTCGNACVAPQLCSLGVCSETCASGLTACGQSCVDLQTNASHCGACGNTCAVGTACVAGACACAAGYTACGAACVDVLTDAQNCGTCGTVCDSGLCLAGVCQASTGAGGTAGTGGETAAGGSGGETAAGGSGGDAAGGAATGGAATVTCETGLTACGTECVNLQTDPNNCGTCYTVCLAGTCNAGVCPTVKDCYKPTVVTSPLFTDFETYDGTTLVTEWGFAFNAPSGTAGAIYAGPYFYGDTGTPTHSMTTGYESVYAVSTANPNATGGGLGFWMGCADLTAYEGISLWVRGTAPTGKASFTLAMEDTSAPNAEDPAGGGTCVAVNADTDCKPGGVEIPVTTTWTQLLVPWASFTGGAAASGAAVAVDGHNITGMNFNVSFNYVAQDPNAATVVYVPEAAAFDLQIDDIRFIEAGACAAGTTLCGVGCVDYQTNHDNCGSCGNACDASRTCVSGQCVCPAGYTDCDGECVNLDIDAQNCGACNSACTGPCVGGSCQASTCTAGMPPVTETCERGTMITLGKYWVNNNQWGADGVSGTQCVWDTCSSGNTIGWGTDWSWSGGAANQVKSYASVVLGWHWGWQVSNTGLPVQISSNSDVTCGWTYNVTTTGTFNVAYDLFTSTSSDPGSGDPTDEIMIWLYSGGGAGPIGSLFSGADQPVSVAATDWNLYTGNNGVWNVYSYVKVSNADTGATLNIMDFMNDLVSRGLMSSSKYLLSVQAGTEVFDGSGQLDTSSYYCTIQ